MTTRTAQTTTPSRSTRIERASVGAVVVNIGGAGLRLVLQIVLARLLGASGYGRFVLGRSWGEVLARFPDQGWELAAVKELPRYDKDGNPGAARGFMRASWRSTSIAAVALSAVAVAGYLALPVRQDTAIVVGLLLPAPLALTYLSRAFLQGHHRFVTGSAIVELFQPVVFGVVVLGLWASDSLDVTSALVAWIATMAATAAVARIVLRRGLETVHEAVELQTEHERWRSTRRPLYVSRLAIVVLDYADILVVGALLAPAEVAAYAVATRIVVLGRVIITGVQSAVSSHLAAAAADENWRETQRIVDRSLRVCALPSIAVTAVAALFADRLVGLFGSGYSSAADILRILLIGNLVNSITGPSAAVVSLSGLEVLYARIMWSAAAATLVLVGIGTSEFGLAGAAWAATTVMITWNAGLLIVARRRLGVSCWMRPSTFARAPEAAASP